MEPLVQPAFQQIAQTGLLGGLLIAALFYWHAERKLLNACGDKLVEAWKTLGELIAAHNQTARETILSQDARSRALEAQTRAYELGLQIEIQRAEAGRAMAQEMKELRVEVERLKEEIRQGSR